MGRPASDVREQLVTAALELLHTKGVRSVVQTRVAKAAGVPQGHLTYYFPKKSDLLVAVARRFREDTAREVARIVGAQAAAGTTPEQRILAVVQTMSENRERTRALVGLALEADALPKLRAELVESIEAIRRSLAFGLGKPAPDADVDVVLAMFWGLGLQHLVLGAERSADYRRSLLERALAFVRGFVSARRTRVDG